MRLAQTVVLATLNRGKFEEFSALMATYCPELKLAPPQEFVRNAEGLKQVEKYSTYLENASAKARLIQMGCHYPTLADDSGLEVDALSGKPGVRSHRFAPPKAGVPQDQNNVDYLLSQMKANPQRTARFVCTLVFSMEGILVHTTATLEGSIASSPRGSQGFGYDSVFIPSGSNKTIAEMTNSEKNAISHRAKAVRELVALVKNHGIVFAKP